MAKPISPQRAHDLVTAGAELIDIREPDEFARQRIAGAINVPAARLGMFQPAGRQPIFVCRSGHRTAVHCRQIDESAGKEAYVLDGGIDAWRAAGLPMETDPDQPLEIMRQVQIAAGFLVLVGILASLVIHPAWIGVSTFVGLGLMLAGVTGWCGMAKLLALLPWNRKPAV
jgi:rhodanese-related sulfurtransferase